MKKFLTVLLALSVVFTYTVGSAFAAVAVEDPEVSGLPTDVRTAVAELTEDMDKAVADAKKELKDAYTEQFMDGPVKITKAMYESVLDQFAADYEAVVIKAADQVTGEEANLKTVISGKPVRDYLVYDETYVAVNPKFYQNAAENLVAYITAKESTNNIATQKAMQDYYIVSVWAKALTQVVSDTKAELTKFDLDLYTDDVMNADDPFQKTWKEAAAEAFAELEKALAEVAIDAALMSRNDAIAEIEIPYDILAKLTPVEVIESTEEDVPDLVVSYKLADPDILTAEDLENAGIIGEASKAALRAEVQKNAANRYSASLKKYNNKEMTKEEFELDKAKVDAYIEINTTLINESVIKKAENFVSLNNSLTRLQDYETAADLAEVLKLQVEKEGTLKYIAAVIDENLADLKVVIYSGQTPMIDNIKVSVAEFLVYGAANVSSNLPWEKEVKVANIIENMNAALDAGYYAPEEAEVKAAYQELIDKVNAAETMAQLNKLAEVVNINDIPTIEDVNDDVLGYLNTTKFYNSVEAYRTNVLNFGVENTKDGYRPAANKEDVAEFLAKSGARTNADVATYFDQVEAYAKALPTIAEIEAAEKALEDAVEAIPTHATLADKSTVVAAYEAAKAAGREEISDMPAKLQTAIANMKAAEAKAINEMIEDLPAKLTAADKAAVDAIYAAIEAYEAEEMYSDAKYSKTDDVDKAFKAVRAAALADVHDAIASLPADPTKAQVEAARAAVDAFVETYTDADADYQAIAKIENLDKLTYAEAQMKVKTIKAVEGLKITASSKAAKGSMTINWKVKGDASYADGFRIYKSKKMNSGFGTKPYFQTKDNTKRSYKNTKELKKGTRYYYKLRAYVVIDGKTYFSDYSNKAYRIAK